MTFHPEMVSRMVCLPGVNYELFAWEERTGHNYLWDVGEMTMDSRVVFQAVLWDLIQVNIEMIQVVRT